MRPLGIALVLIALGVVGATFHARAYRATPALPSVVLPIVVDAGAVEPVGPAVILTAVVGRVERLRDGAWEVVSDGASLSADEHLRTGDDGEATIVIPSVGTIVLAPRSDFEVGRRTQELMSLQLGHGLLRADVDHGGALPLRVAIRDSDTVAESRDGSFSVLTAGSGAVAVATARGSVALTAATRTVQVEAGQLSVVAAGAAPSAPHAIPPSLILKLARGPRTVTRREVTVSGRTTPGAIVTLAAAGPMTVTADGDGRFSARVSLREGRNHVVVEALDPVGRRGRAQLPVIVDTRPPDVEAEVRWGR